MKSTRWAAAPAVFAALAAVLAIGCSKSARSEKNAPASDELAESGAATEGAEPTAPQPAADIGEPIGDGPDETDLEGAIAQAKQRGGTLTAVSGAGKTVVHAVGTSLADTDTYSVSVEIPADTAAGTDSVVKLHVIPKPGWKLNQEFPTKLKIEAPEGVSVAAAEQSAKDAAKFGEKAAIFEVGFKAAAAGKKTFAGELRFAVCTDTTCDPKTAKLAWAVDVE